MNNVAFSSSGVIADDISRIAGQSIEQVRPFSVGQETDIYIADLKNGRRVIVKRARQADMSLDVEGWMLNFLKERTKLPVPDVLCAERSLLMMTYIPDSGRITGAVEEDAAKHLAALHSIKNAYYGFDRDTRIGPFVQPNALAGNWISFFRDYRLMAMAREAMKEGALPTALMKKIETLAGRLDRWLGGAAAPALIHGDLWSGNVLTSAHKVNAFIDPAIYYADPEIELAFISLFATFGDRFFGRYKELAGMRDGFFEERRDIYVLYPLLVHARIFGGAYIEKIAQITDRLVGSAGR